MDFAEEIKQVAEEARAECEREKAEDYAFADWWETFRTQEAMKVFRITAEQVGAALGGATPEKHNGSVSLRAGRSGTSSYSYFLTFSPAKEKRGAITCTSSFDPEGESFTRDALTPDVLQEKVKRFVRAVIRGDKSSGATAPTAGVMNFR